MKNMIKEVQPDLTALHLLMKLIHNESHTPCFPCVFCKVMIYMYNDTDNDNDNDVDNSHNDHNNYNWWTR